jgi:hypothetical protein
VEGQNGRAGFANVHRTARTGVRQDATQAVFGIHDAVILLRREEKIRFEKREATMEEGKRALKGGFAWSSIAVLNSDEQNNEPAPGRIQFIMARTAGATVAPVLYYNIHVYSNRA